MTNFISSHLIKKIKNQVIEKVDRLGFKDNLNPFLYFEELVDEGNRNINRVKLTDFKIVHTFKKEETIPLSAYNLEGPVLKEIFERIKQNKFYTYRKIDGKDHKIRLKK